MAASLSHSNTSRCQLSRDTRIAGPHFSLLIGSFCQWLTGFMSWQLLRVAIHLNLPCDEEASPHVRFLLLSLSPSVFSGKERRPAGRHTSHGSIRICCRDSVAFHCWTADFCLESAWDGFQYEATEQPNYEYISVLLLKFNENCQTQSGFEKPLQRGYRLSGEWLSVSNICVQIKWLRKTTSKISYSECDILHTARYTKNIPLP